jgi:hypothetical protein
MPALNRLEAAAMLLLLGCQDPFKEDRHDLVSPRIAGIRAMENEEGLLELAALVSSSTGLAPQTAPVLSWEVNDQSFSEPWPVLSVSYPVEIFLTLEADGVSEQGVFELEEAPAGLAPATSWYRRLTELAPEEAALPPEQRAGAQGEDRPLQPGEAVEVGFEFAEENSVRWMGTGGEFRELDARSTDWFAAGFLVDDEDVEDISNLETGVYTLAGLRLGQGNAWDLVDVVVGDQPVVSVGARLVPVDTVWSESGLFSGILALTEQKPGFQLEQLQSASLEQAPAVCGQEAGVAFELVWLAEGGCGLDELLGQRLVFAP